MKQNLTKREYEVLKYLEERTNEDVSVNTLLSIGTDTQYIANNLFIDRSNVSRILSKLHELNLVIKIITRPAIFIHKKTLSYKYKKMNFDNIYKNQSDLITLLNTSSEKEELNIFKGIIGNKPNMVMYPVITDILSAISYPVAPLSLMLISPDQKEVNLLIKLILKYLESSNYQFKEVVTKDFLIKDDFTLIQNLLKNDDDSNIIYILKNISTLDNESVKALKSVMSGKSNCFFLATNDDNTDIDKLFHITVKIPQFNDRTILERIFLIFNCLQNEVDVLNCNLNFDSNVLNCLVLSNYDSSTFSLTKEVKRAMAIALGRKVNNSISISLNDLSNSLLENIFDINDCIDELNIIYKVLNTKEFTLRPSKEYLAIKALNNKLYYNNEKELNLIDSSATTTNYPEIDYKCLQHLKTSLKTSFRSIDKHLLDDIAKYLSPILNNQLIAKNELLYNGLLSSISDLIENKRSNKRFLEDIDSLNIQDEDYLLTIKIIEAIKQKESIELNYSDIYFIYRYLIFARSIIDKVKIPILFLCLTSGIAKNFANFTSTLDDEIICDYCDFSLTLTRVNINSLKLKLDKMCNQKGILILTDRTIDDETNKLIKEECNCDSIIIEDIDVDKLVTITKLIKKPDTLLLDFEKFTSPIDLQFDGSEQMTDFIKREFLEDSLIFLNPDKLCKASLNSLNKITSNLKLESTEYLTINFITHMGFAIERIIKEHRISYKNSAKFLQTNADTYNIVKDGISYIEDLFGITFPINEIIYITLLFTL